LTFFQITEEETDPVASGSSNQLDQEGGRGSIEIVPAREREKKGDSTVDEACGLLRAVKINLEKKNGIFSIFGEFVVNKIRHLNSSRLQSVHRPAQNTRYTVGRGDGVT
jgi:hypothetical protein